MLSVAIEKKRVAGRSVVQIAVHSAEFLSKRFKLISLKDSLIIEGADSVVPVQQAIEEQFPNVRFVSMVELEVLSAGE
jgi:hypothetical protein